MVWTIAHARLHQILRQRRLLSQRERVLIAVSGGQDSLCLLELLRALQPKWQWELAIAHCDHRWSTDAGIAEHVEILARDRALPFHLRVAPPLPETEAAAREWRYRALGEIALEEEFTVVVVAHTLSDRAETVFYNLVRGAGSDGLQSLDWERPLVPGVRLVRPLLEMTRTETGQFCRERGLPVWEDAANEKWQYARTRIRKEVLPYLKANFNPQVELALARTAEVLRAESDYLEAEAMALWERATGATEEERSPSRIHRPSLQAAPLALQRRALRHFLRPHLRRQPTFEQIDSLVQLIDAPNRSRTSSLPGGTPEQPRSLWGEVAGDWIVLQNLA